MKTILILFLMGSVCYGFTDQEYVNAIYKAEGGKHAKYPYGIRSIKCSGDTECSKICLNTVKRNRTRFKKYGFKNYSNFTAFLGDRYCPPKGPILSIAEQRVNKNWVKNVNYFLKKG